MQAPLCVEGWDEALYEIGRLSSDTVLSEQNASLLVKAVKDTPVLVIAGAEDALVPLKSVQAMSSKFVDSVSISYKLMNLAPFFWFSIYLLFDKIMTCILLQTLVAISSCGHLPHEECPKVLLAAMLPFISKLLSKTDK